MINSSLKGEEGKDTGCPLENNSDKKDLSGIRRAAANIAVTKLIDSRKLSSLTKLVRVIARIWRAAMKRKMVLRKNFTSRKSKWKEFEVSGQTCCTYCWRVCRRIERPLTFDSGGHNLPRIDSKSSLSKKQQTLKAIFKFGQS